MTSDARACKRILLHLLWLCPYLVLVAIAMTWPANGPFLGHDFRNSWLVDLVPSIAAYRRKSAFPSATAAYMVLSSMLPLPIFVVSLLRPRFVFGSSRAMCRYLQRCADHPVLMPVGTLLASMLAVCGAWIQEGYQFALLPLNDERWALALGGPLFAFPCLFFYLVSCSAFAAKLLFVVVKELRDGVE